MNMEERVYSVRVTATDDAGLVGVDTCHIVVGAENDNALAAPQRDLKAKKSVRGAADKHLDDVIANSDSAKAYELTVKCLAFDSM
ncbi:expressed unknown protein [Seminavis robusta]|uniref:Cadherin domain-containing protein n=1 Tax=Seminavis robusta TaxID=568900 RepID=A0A9N8E203_9STRA|nr:expressed unknown protein [Seminavis robusta]|eukprot:Sro567_g168040.1 n/a (85) ;mRNA; f:39862-40116